MQTRRSLTFCAGYILVFSIATIGTDSTNSTRNGGCQKKGNMTKEDIIPAFREYILEQLGVDEETASLEVNLTELDQEELAESMLITTIEDTLPPYQATKPPTAKSVKSYAAQHVKKSSVTKAIPSGMALHKQIYQIRFAKLRNKDGLSKIQLLLYQTPLRRKETSELPPDVYTAEISYKMYVGGQSVIIPLSTTTIHANKLGYTVLDVTGDKGQWLKNLNGKYVVLVVTVYNEGRKEDFTAGRNNMSCAFVTDVRNHTRVPRLVISREAHFKEEVRSKREITEPPTTTSTYEQCSTKNQNCCRKDLVIDFKRDISMQFVVEPPSLNIGKCEGACLGDKTPEYQNYYTFMGKTDPMIRPCCVPDQVRNVTITATTNGSAASFQLRDAIILSCKCV